MDYEWADVYNNDGEFMGCVLECTKCYTEVIRFSDMPVCPNCDGEQMIIADWGPEKSGKTSFAMTMEEPIWIADFDLRIDGALHRLPDLKYKAVKYPMPIQFSKQLKGVRELWEKFTVEFVSVLEDQTTYNGEPFRTIVIDTATQMQKTVRDALLQTKQEAQISRNNGCVPPDLRERLQQMEYGEPNGRMQAIIYAPRQYNKHMVLTHYAADEFKDMLVNGEIKTINTGKIQLDGFKHTEGLVDLVIATSSRNSGSGKEFYGKITTSGIDAKLEGMEFKDPTYQGIMDALQMIRGE